MQRKFIQNNGTCLKSTLCSYHHDVLLKVARPTIQKLNSNHKSNDTNQDFDITANFNISNTNFIKINPRLVPRFIKSSMKALIKNPTSKLS